MQRTPIKSSIPTLRPGDVITNLACGECADKQILVLERHQTDCSFDFSVRGNSLSITKDVKGPFHWRPGMNTFVDQNGRAYEHINRESVVIQGAGMTELGWYCDLPKPDEAPFLINMETLTDPVAHAKLVKIDAIVARVHSHGGRLGVVTSSMQQAIMLALGNAEVSEDQMRTLLVVVNSYLADAVLTLERKSAGDMLDAALVAVFGEMGSFDGGMGSFGRGSAGSSRPERHPAHAD
jgi:hypothetical protein